jgi:hypothetical protein
MNRSIEIGKYPSKLKYAKIVPIYKNDDDEVQETIGLSLFSQILIKFTRS